MLWTREQQLSALLRLPWTVRVDRDSDDGWLVARVAEIPSAIATGGTEEELEREFWESLQASLEVYLDYGDAIPLPPAVRRYPWEPDPDAPKIERVMATYERGEFWSQTEDTAALAAAVADGAAA